MNREVLKKVLLLSTATAIVLFAVLIIPQFAFAAPGDPPLGLGNAIRPSKSSTGTLMAAALESAGYKAQSQVLTQLYDILKNLGMLIYVVAFMGAIATVGLGGKYDRALWFLMGPGIFLFLINSRTASAGVEWQFAGKNLNEGNVASALNAGDSINAEVSWVFDSYNVLISDIIQNLIKVITNEDQKKRVKFMTRTKIMDELIASQITGPGVLAATQFTLAACERPMTAARLVALGNRDPNFRKTPEFKRARHIYKEEFGGPGNSTPKRIVLPEGPVRESFRDILSHQAGFGTTQSAQEQSFPLLRSCYSEIGDGFESGNVGGQLSNPVNCQQLWCWLGLGVQREAVRIQEEASRHIQANPDDEAFKEVWNDIYMKLATPPSQTNFDQTRNPTVQPDLSLIPVIIGGKMLQKAMSSSLDSRGLNGFADSADVKLAPYNYSTYNSIAERQEILQRRNQAMMSDAKKYEIYTFANTLPYIQGVILYVLGLTFPFFALMAILPGQAGAFFQWMALWAWAKSWDLGWAFVMVIDDLMWSLMPHSSYYDPIADPNHGPISVFESAFQGDLSYSTAGYYALLGMMLTAVPMLTGEAILGTKKALGGILVGGMQNLGAGFGKSAADYVAMEQLGKIDWMREGYLSNYEKAHRGQSATPELAAYKSKLEGWSSWGTGAKIAGTALVVGGAAVVAAPVVAAVGAGAGIATAIGGALGTGMGFGGAAAAVSGVAVTRTGFSWKRNANARMADYVRQNARQHFWNAGREEGYRRHDQDRAGVSGRGEYFNTPDLAVTLNTDLQVLSAKTDQEMRGAFGEVGGRLLADVTSARQYLAGRL